MQLVWVVVAGAALAWLYLAAFHVLLCGDRAPRMSLLLAIAGFIQVTGLVLTFMWVVADGRPDRLVAVLAGFVVARALLDTRMLGRWEGDEPVIPAQQAEPLGQQPLDRLA